MGDYAGTTIITFDGDQTLWDFFAAMRTSLADSISEIRNAVGAAADTLTVDRLIAIREAAAADLSESETTHEAIRREAFRRTLAEIGHPDDVLAEQLASRYLERRFANIEPYPDVLPALDRLSARYPIGLISNGNTYPDRIGLGGRFAFTVFGQQVGCRKPDSRIFQIAAERAGVSCEQILHVGDMLEADVYGAQQAGCIGVWLNRDGSVNDTDIIPDHEITTLTDLVPMLHL